LIEVNIFTLVGEKAVAQGLSRCCSVAGRIKKYPGFSETNENSEKTH